VSRRYGLRSVLVAVALALAAALARTAYCAESISELLRRTY